MKYLLHVINYKPTEEILKSFDVKKFKELHSVNTDSVKRRHRIAALINSYWFCLSTKQWSAFREIPYSTIVARRNNDKSVYEMFDIPEPKQ